MKATAKTVEEKNRQEQGGRSSPENLRFKTNLQALEMKKRHQEKSSAGSAPAPVVFTTNHEEEGSAGPAPAPVVTTTTDIGPIDALTLDKINTVATIGGTPAAPDKMNNRRYVELLVDSGAVDNVGDPRAFP